MTGIEAESRKRNLSNMPFFKMMKINNIFDTIFSDENLYEAIQDAARGRRYQKDVLRAVDNCWNYVEEIQRQIYSEGYQIEKYYIFYAYEPKKRMIMSIIFYHRIVQWAIYRVLNPLLIRGYIEDSYGCVPGRGALGAMQRLHGWVQAVNNKPGTWYYLKLDISKYFYRINHDILKRILAKKIKDERLMKLLCSIIDCEHTPFGLPPGKSPGEVPLEERLYSTGMPIGNLLSQVFANVYLDVLDQYCKRTMRIKYYVRYMDDIIILYNDKTVLRSWMNEISTFLKNDLALDLNQKTCIRPISQGVEFVGYRIWPHYVTLRKSTTLKMKRTMRKKQKQYHEREITFCEVTDTLNSYTGMLKHCDCKTFRKELVQGIILTHGDNMEEQTCRQDLYCPSQM